MHGILSEQRAAPQSMPLAGGATDSAIDAYAGRVLASRSPPETCVEPSLAPYVTSVLRASSFVAAASSGTASSFPSEDDYANLATDIEEYDSLMELLQEHCGMDETVARSAIRSIAAAVRTGTVDPFGEEIGTSSFGGTPLAGSLNALGGTGGNSGVSSLAGSLNAMSFGAGFGGRGYRSESIDDAGDALVSDLGQMLKDGLTNGSRSTSGDQLNTGASSFVLDEDLPGFSGSAALASPVKEDNLLPHDLLGELDDDPPNPSASGDSNESKPSSREEKKEETAASVTVAEFAASQMSQRGDAAAPTSGSSDFPSIAESSAPEPAKSRDGLPPKSGGGKGSKKKKKKQDLDLAASLFSTSRSRSNSVPTEKSPMLKPMVSPDTMTSPLAPMGNNFGGMGGPGMTSPMGDYGGPPDAYLNQQVQSTAEILLTMNHSLGEHAAYEAAMVSNADINVAQYVIDGAMGAAPVCRHLLNGGCYRSDCQFSHDVDGHTCLFWIRGRCNKGDECQFRHGFCAKLLEGINQEMLSGAASGTPVVGGYGEYYDQGPIQTGNLIQRNAAASYGQGMPGGIGSYNSSPFASPNLKPAAPGRQGSDFASFSLSGGETSAPAPYAPAPSSGPGVSFANIATSGYNNKASFAEPEGGSRGGVGTLTQFARIPQDLWLGSEQRDSSVFHIADPMERYAEVAKNNPRQDVLDLHFQSIKTFPVVLSAVLDEMLETCDVWVVTGSGHHVDKSSHQKRGGVLEEAVASWLDMHGYVYAQGRDRNGHGGAVLVKRQQQ